MYTYVALLCDRTLQNFIAYSFTLCVYTLCRFIVNQISWRHLSMPRATCSVRRLVDTRTSKIDRSAATRFIRHGLTENLTAEQKHSLDKLSGRTVGMEDSHTASTGIVKYWAFRKLCSLSSFAHGLTSTYAHNLANCFSWAFVFKRLYWESAEQKHTLEKLSGRTVGMDDSHTASSGIVQYSTVHRSYSVQRVTHGLTHSTHMYALALCFTWTFELLRTLQESLHHNYMRCLQKLSIDGAQTAGIIGAHSLCSLWARIFPVRPWADVVFSCALNSQVEFAPRWLSTSTIRSADDSRCVLWCNWCDSWRIFWVCFVNHSTSASYIECMLCLMTNAWSLKAHL